MQFDKNAICSNEAGEGCWADPSWAATGGE